MFFYVCITNEDSVKNPKLDRFYKLQFFFSRFFKLTLYSTYANDNGVEVERNLGKKSLEIGEDAVLFSRFSAIVAHGEL